MGFGNHKKVTDAHGQTGDWIKFKEGDSLSCVLSDDCVWGPAAFVGNKYVPGTWTTKNGDLEFGSDDNLRFAVSVYVPADKRVKVLDQTQSLYTALGTLGDDLDGLGGKLIKITKKAKNAWTCSLIKELSEKEIDKLSSLEDKDLTDGSVSWLKDVNVKALRKANRVAEGLEEAVPEEAESAEVDDDDIPF